MLREIEHEYVKQTQALTKSLGDFRADAPPEQMELFLQELTSDMEYYRENAKLCRYLLSPGGDLYFRQKMVESISHTVDLNVQKYGGIQLNEDYHYLVHYFASGFISTI